MHKYGLRYVKVNNPWAISVPMMLNMTHKTLRPVLSTKIPKAGDPIADMLYTKEVTVFAVSGSNAYFRIKYTLQKLIFFFFQTNIDT